MGSRLLELRRYLSDAKRGEDLKGRNREGVGHLGGHLWETRIGS